MAIVWFGGRPPLAAICLFRYLLLSDGRAQQQQRLDTNIQQNGVVLLHHDGVHVHIPVAVIPGNVVVDIRGDVVCHGISVLSGQIFDGAHLLFVYVDRHRLDD